MTRERKFGSSSGETNFVQRWQNKERKLGGSGGEANFIERWQNKETKLGVPGEETNFIEKWQNIERKFGGSGGQTIFIDDLPEKMDQRWLGNIFSKNGSVLNVYIPWRRRMGSNTRSEFVTFSSQMGVVLAIARFNGIWCVDRRLQVSKSGFNPKC
ncbi:hypothetical protein U1Q18_015678 [Sarracenia purpurea var. burkii]